MATRSNIGIIGAGLSGLYAACYLAKNGHSVTIFDKNKQTGGRSQTFSANGFTFDMGPSWYWMPDLIDEMFENLNERRDDHYQLKRLDTSYQVLWKDGTRSKIPADEQALIDLFDSFESNGGEKLTRFLKDAETKYTIAKPFMSLPGDKLGELISFKVVKSSLQLDVFKSVAKDVSKRFVSEKARSILNFPVLFLGAMPDKIPSLYTLMNFADLKLGTWYPDGGMNALAKALTKIAEDNGVQIHLETPVVQIKEDNGQVTGIVTSDQTYSFDHVISSGDYHFTEQLLIPKKFRRYDEKYWDKRKMAPSALIFYLGIDEELKNMEHHNLFFDADLNVHGESIYVDKKWPEKPLFYACVPSKTDPNVAPEGKENLFVLMPIATDLNDNEETREKYLQIILDRIKQRTGNDIADKIIYKRSFSVSDFKSEYNSYKGNAYGLANTLMQTANLKPKVKSKLKNLYFCGQLTVPGPGIPPALLSGQIAAKQILRA